MNQVKCRSDFYSAGKEDIGPAVSFILENIVFECSIMYFPGVGVKIVPAEGVINNGVYLKNRHYSLQILNDLRINKDETTLYSAFIYGIPINQYFVNQLSEIQLGANFNSNNELAPSISIKRPDLTFSLSYHFFIGDKIRFPILQNSFETNFALNINCHRRNNESEKMRCNK